LTTPPLRYWGRYRKRWRKTYLVFAVLAPLSWMTTPAASHDGLFLIFLNLFLAATLEAAFVAVFVNLLVALFPATAPMQAPAAATPSEPGAIAARPWFKRPLTWISTGAVLVVIVAILVIVLVANPANRRSPEEAYVAAIRTAEPHSATTSDDVLLASGRIVCDIYTKQGAAGVTTALNHVYATNGAEARRVMGVISHAATTYLCPTTGR
jgi:hypothetical protein